MSETVYLYSYGRRRHMAAGAITGWSSKTHRPSLCGDWFETDDTMSDRLRRWYDPEVADRNIAKARALPVCAHCEKAAKQ